MILEKLANHYFSWDTFMIHGIHDHKNKMKIMNVFWVLIRNIILETLLQTTHKILSITINIRSFM